MSTPTPTAPSLPPPRLHQGAIGWMRASLFSSPLNTLLTVLVAWLVLMAVPAMIEWLFIRADFNATNAQECRVSGGACWAFIAEKTRRTAERRVGEERGSTGRLRWTTDQ